MRLLRATDVQSYRPKLLQPFRMSQITYCVSHHVCLRSQRRATEWTNGGSCAKPSEQVIVLVKRWQEIAEIKEGKLYSLERWNQTGIVLPSTSQHNAVWWPDRKFATCVRLGRRARCEILYWKTLRQQKTTALAILWCYSTSQELVNRQGTSSTFKTSCPMRKQFTIPTPHSTHIKLPASILKKRLHTRWKITSSFLFFFLLNGAIQNLQIFRTDSFKQATIVWLKKSVSKMCNFSCMSHQQSIFFSTLCVCFP